MDPILEEEEFKLDPTQEQEEMERMPIPEGSERQMEPGEPVSRNRAASKLSPLGHEWKPQEIGAAKREPLRLRPELALDALKKRLKNQLAHQIQTAANDLAIRHKAYIGVDIDFTFDIQKKPYPKSIVHPQIARLKSDGES
jgi:hypothetical protein